MSDGEMIATDPSSIRFLYGHILLLYIWRVNTGTCTFRETKTWRCLLCLGSVYNIHLLGIELCGMILEIKQPSLSVSWYLSSCSNTLSSSCFLSFPIYLCSRCVFKCVYFNQLSADILVNRSKLRKQEIDLPLWFYAWYRSLRGKREKARRETPTCVKEKRPER